MLSFFPTPYPDELLYSVFARYHERSGNTSYKATLRDLFGRTTVVASFDLPSHLDELCSRLPRGTDFTPERLIAHHTMFPYYASFLPKVRAQKIMQMMKNGSGSGLHASAGIMAGAVAAKTSLCFCTKCFSEDIETYGEPYWHRIHQAPGVFVCPKHETLLMQSEFIEFNRHFYKALPLRIDTFSYRPVLEIGGLSEKTYRLLKGLASDVQWIFQGSKDVGFYDAKNLYLPQLQSKGFVSVNGRVRQRKLQEQMTFFLGQELLQIVGCHMDGDSHWLTMMTRKPRKVIHPLKHLLFIRFLYGSLENFINGYSLQEYLPFGRGPWPCLNKAANHYMKPVVHDCFITPCSKARLPVGTFICNCGFVYARRGPDHSEEDRYKVGRIKSFGGVWLKRLNELIHIEKTSYRYAAKILGVNTKTVIKYMNLQTPAESYEIKHKQKVRNESKLIKKTVSQKTRRNKTHHSQRVDWELRDLELSIRIEILCQELLSSKEKPVRITMTGIARRLGHLSLLLRNRRKLPVCMAILDKYRESIEEFQIRRVRWAVSQLEGYWSIKRWRIEKLAGLKPGYSETVRWEIEKYVTSTNFGVLRDNEVNNNWLH